MQQYVHSRYLLSVHGILYSVYAVINFVKKVYSFPVLVFIMSTGTFAFGI